MLRTLSLLAALLTPLSARADAADDVQALKTGGIPIEGPALLKFIRGFAPSGVDPASVSVLVAQLGAEEFGEREAAVKHLITLGPRAAPFLRQALRDPDRERAMRAEHCLKVIDSGPGPSVQAAALRQIASLKPPQAAAAILEYLPFAPNERLAEDAMAALKHVARSDGKVDPALVAALTDKAPLRRGAAAEALCHAGATEHHAAIKNLLADLDAGVRFRAGMSLLHAKDKDALVPLIELLGQVNANQQGLIEGALYRLAGDKAPSLSTRDAWTAWLRANNAQIDLAKLDAKGTALGFTLITVAGMGSIQELDRAGKLRWQIQGLNYPLSVQWLGADKVLIAEYRGRRVTERNTKGEVLWEYTMPLPLQAQRLPNGNTFLASRTQLLEIDAKGNQVLVRPMPGQFIMAARKLPGGQIVCLTTGGACVRLDAAGKEVNRFPIGMNVNFGVSFDVTPEGRILVPQMTRNKIVEFSPEGKVEREIDAPSPQSVSLLENGNLLVSSKQADRILEINPLGQVVWEHRVANAGPASAIRR